ncbi:hypothetical protein QFC20_003776 [Naganishia adeliensis]|uniref:Uncharacterized protein n=1 Tax=Naganishia adeliensis TaxID=92952 RepID=A0ACC2W741_9TREE|nr:hypothetical protein QFC20_003776 [Naganishia adeliensis]
MAAHLPDKAEIAKEAKECVQECVWAFVWEFILFLLHRTRRVHVRTRRATSLQGTIATRADGLRTPLTGSGAAGKASKGKKRAPDCLEDDGDAGKEQKFVPPYRLLSNGQRGEIMTSESKSCSIA